MSKRQRPGLAGSGLASSVVAPLGRHQGQDRVGGVGGLAGEVDAREQPLQHAAREHADIDVRCLQRAARSRHRAGLDGGEEEAAVLRRWRHGRSRGTSWKRAADRRPDARSGLRRRPARSPAWRRAGGCPRRRTRAPRCGCGCRACRHRPPRARRSRAPRSARARGRCAGRDRRSARACAQAVWSLSCGVALGPRSTMSQT